MVLYNQKVGKTQRRNKMKSKRMELVKELVKLAVELGGENFELAQRISYIMLENGMTSSQAYQVWKKLAEEAK